MGQFEHIIVDGAEQVLAEHLAGIDRIEAIGIVRREEFAALADIERGAVGGDGDDKIILAELQPLGGLDRGDQIGDARQPQKLQLGDDLRIDVPPGRQIGPSGRRC